MYAPSGVCDLYMNCEMVTNNYLLGDYPNLNPNDAIKSANVNNKYNCLAWVAGISPNGNTPPGTFFSWNYNPNETITGYSHPDDTPLGSMDYFLGNYPNPRYAGAWTYTRAGADENNATIALWASDLGYTHLSIRKPGNDHPHGYDWESKMSGDERIMHPKNALNGNFLGQIVAYYRVAPSGARLSAETNEKATPQGISLEESLNRGLSVLEEQNWTTAELDLLKKLTDGVAPLVAAEFNGLYQRWVEKVNTPAIRSSLDQRSHKKLAEYTDLAGWIKRHGPVTFPLLLNQFFIEPAWAIDAIVDLTADPYRPLWKEVGVENNKNLYDDRGRYFVRSQSTNCARYIKKMLNVLPVASTPKLMLAVAPNPANAGTTVEFYLPQAATVSLNITSARGEVVNALIDKKPLAAGWHTAFWDGKSTSGASVQTGIYIGSVTTETGRETIQIIVN